MFWNINVWEKKKKKIVKPITFEYFKNLPYLQEFRKKLEPQHNFNELKTKKNGFFTNLRREKNRKKDYIVHKRRIKTHFPILSSQKEQNSKKGKGKKRRIIIKTQKKVATTIKEEIESTNNIRKRRKTLHSVPIVSSTLLPKKKRKEIDSILKKEKVYLKRRRNSISVNFPNNAGLLNMSSFEKKSFLTASQYSKYIMNDFFATSNKKKNKRKKPRKRKRNKRISLVPLYQ